MCIVSLLATASMPVGAEGRLSVTANVGAEADVGSVHQVVSREMREREARRMREADRKMGIAAHFSSSFIPHKSRLGVLSSHGPYACCAVFPHSVHLP